MEDIPPSYYQSMNPSVLDLIAPYLDTPSLHTLTLVSRTYNDVLMPHLWGSPASHFVPLAGPTQPGLSDSGQTDALHDDMVYVALTRFKRVLKRARLSTRCLVHTLYLPPAVSEIYGGPNATWLKEVLDGLPNLQSLCVGGLPFFDHHSLAAVDKHRPSIPNEGFQTYPLKLLLASKEPNATSIGLSLFLPHVANLIYLDLSYTTPARDMNVLSSLYALHDLQVLKLRGIGLRDLEAGVLAKAIGLRVRLLDVADNLLSDKAVQSLLLDCFIHTGRDAQNPQQNNISRSGYHIHNASRQLESWPVGLPPAPDYLSLDTLRSSEFDKNLLVQLTNPLTGRLAFEDIPHGGLTHLYITGNQAVTIEGVRSLLDVGRLHVLDVGEVAGETALDKHIRNTIEMGKAVRRPRSMTSGGRSIASTLDTYDGDLTQENQFHLPGAEKLIPVLREKASKNLTYFRIDHAIVTSKLDMAKHSVEIQGSIPKSNINLGGVSELSARPGDTQVVEAPGSSRHAVEMPTDQIFELDATPVFRAELPGDLIHFAVSPPVGERPVDLDDIEGLKVPIRGEGAYAPEVVTSDGSDSEQEEHVVLDATGTGMRESQKRPASHPVLSRIATTVPSSQTSITPNPLINHAANSHLSLTKDRQAKLEALINARSNQSPSRLHPSFITNMRTLILTNVPSQVSQSSEIIPSLKAFITACASEAYIAMLRAKTNYSLPPGRARAAAEREDARSVFALRTVVLEIVPATSDKVAQRDWRHIRQGNNQYKSSTGDRDSEALWSAAENDFSFFGEEGEEMNECGIYEHEPGKYFPSVMVDDKFAVLDDPSSPSSNSTWYNGTSGSFPDNDNYSISSPKLGSVSGTVFRSPRELPLGRNRRSSNDAQRGSSSANYDPIQRFASEMPGTMIPSSPPRVITSGPTSAPKHFEQLTSPIMLDVVSELSKFRKERKLLYEGAVRRLQLQQHQHQQHHDHYYQNVNPQPQSQHLPTNPDVFIEGHWKGEIKVIRTNNRSTNKSSGNTSGGTQGRLERTGMVDIYGNYFEKGYLYS